MPSEGLPGGPQPAPLPCPSHQPWTSLRKNSSVIREIDGFWRSLASQEDAVLLHNPRVKDQLSSSNSDPSPALWGSGGASGPRAADLKENQPHRFPGLGRIRQCRAQLCHCPAPGWARLSFFGLPGPPSAPPITLNLLTRK